MAYLRARRTQGLDSIGFSGISQLRSMPINGEEVPYNSAPGVDRLRNLIDAEEK